ncbi:SKA complex subunit 3 [Chanos chanos]|uniref:SKA complex subunit 3 n=1 Tax=Chanos chanos TaxID=29144 RepID=A0A6J2WGN9_CHACN|nr:spindle and kinetochore-associated protein 3 [Chanos chanos]
MDTSARFFAKLRSLAVFVETETANLQNASQNFNEDEDCNEGAVQVLYDLRSEVKGLKQLVQTQLMSHDNEASEVRRFIKTCLVLKQRTTEDIERLKKHYEKYGYRPLKTAQKPTDVEGDPGAAREEQTEKEVGGETEKDEEECNAGKETEEHLPGTPEKMPPPPLPPVDPMRTPQLSDFGLSELHLQRVLGNPGLSQDPPPRPAVALSPPPLVMSLCPPKPKTPKCVLRMDEDAPTPRLEDFGISEYTMCLNNDFTMDLYRKKPTKTESKTEEPSRMPNHNLSTPESSSVLCHDSNESMESPEQPVFCTPGFKITKHRALSTPPQDGENAPESPPTPEIPAFETPYVSKLLSVRKEDRQESKPHPLERPTANRASGMSTTWSSDIPEMPVRLTQKDEPTPEMPTLQSFLGSSLPFKTVSGMKMAGRHGMSGPKEPPTSEQQTLDGHTQEWSLASPQVRMNFPLEISTPDMPDMSSITQDIFKLVSQTKSKPTTTSQQLNSKPGHQVVAPGKENRAPCLAPVSEGEFHGLAGYLRQIPLSSLNQAIHKINSAVQEQHTGGDPNCGGFQMDELKRILAVGPKAPMYILSLVELKRLENIQGVGTYAYRILSQT